MKEMLFERGISLKEQTSSHSLLPIVSLLFIYFLLQFQTFITEHHFNCAHQGFRVQTDDVCAAGANLI